MLERPVSVGNGLEKKFRLSLSINPLRVSSSFQGLVLHSLHIHIVDNLVVLFLFF